MNPTTTAAYIDKNDLQLVQNKKLSEMPEHVQEGLRDNLVKFNEQFSKDLGITSTSSRITIKWFYGNKPREISAVRHSGWNKNCQNWWNIEFIGIKGIGIRQERVLKCGYEVFWKTVKWNSVTLTNGVKVEIPCEVHTKKEVVAVIKQMGEWLKQFGVDVSNLK